MRWPFLLALLALAGATLLAGCTKAAAPTDARVDAPADARDDQPADLPKDGLADQRRAWDARPSDAAQDTQRDIGAIDPALCGGSSTIVPTLVPPTYAAQPCGAGCVQVSANFDVPPQYAVKGNLLVYSSGSEKQGQRVYYTTLANRKQYRVQAPFPPPNAAHGCTLVATDGQKLGYTCVRDGWNQQPLLYWVRSATTFDPTTHLERDHHCFVRWLADGACYPDALGMGPRGLALEMGAHGCASDAIFVDTALSQASNLTNAPGSVGNLHMDGDLVVWSHLGRIQVHDLQTGKTTTLEPQATRWQCHPRVDGKKIVWTDFRNSASGSCLDWFEGDIYMHDLQKGVTEPVTTHPAQQAWPDVSGDWVVWQDYRHAQNPQPGAGSPDMVDVYAKNMATGAELRITDGSKRAFDPRVDAGRVFYRQLDAQSHSSVFMVDLAVRQAQSKDAGAD